MITVSQDERDEDGLGKADGIQGRPAVVLTPEQKEARFHTQRKVAVWVAGVACGCTVMAAILSVIP